MLAKEIVALQKRGYTLEQIAETLRGEGLAISTPTLKSYLQRIKLGKNKLQSGAKKDAQKSPPARITLDDKQQQDRLQMDGLGTLANASFTPKPDTDDI